ASSAPYADSNNNVNSASYASSNGNADSASYADSNGNAGSAPYADSNGNAGSAPYAGSNGNADSASYAGSNGNAGSANYASDGDSHTQPHDTTAPAGVVNGWGSTTKEPHHNTSTPADSTPFATESEMNGGPPATAGDVATSKYQLDKDDPLSEHAVSTTSDDAIRTAIVDVLRDRPKQTCAVKSATSYILKELNIRTRGEPFRIFDHRVRGCIQDLASQRILEIYQNGTNIRIKLLSS
nr:hypothetical protein [Pseudomonadota bacterium]